jgi:hypothetical protein
MPYIASPDGRARDTVRRTAVYRDPRQIKCPACRVSISRATARTGDYFLTCENRVRIPGSSEKKSCAQHLYILGSPAGLWAVVTITPEEYEATSGWTGEAPRLLHSLGILPAAYSALALAKVT